ncbi:MAG: glycosyltransferase family 2 protein [Phycisphaerales bacterium]
MSDVDVQLENGRYQGPRPPVSVVILTYNEEGNIADCIRSCAWSDDVHVLDSGSSDRTREIAESLGATVHVNPFRSFGQQRNWAIDNITCRHHWHFHLDADERFTVESVQEMVTTLGPAGEAPPHVCYLVPSKMIFMGRWLKRSGGYPSYQVRLFRFGKCRFLDFGHGQREDPQGSVGTMAQPYLHYSFSKGLFEWLNKHNAYSDREAMEGLHLRGLSRPPFISLFQGDPTQRRRAFKNFSYYLKFRSVWRFFYNFILRLGILDGLGGLHYCLMISMYEYWIELKIKERQLRWTHETNLLVERMNESSRARVDHRPSRARFSPGVAPHTPPPGGTAGQKQDLTPAAAATVGDAA